MIYLASLNITSEDKINGYIHIKTKRDLDRLVATVDKLSTVIIREDFAKEFLLTQSTYIDEARRINGNVTIEYETQGVYEYIDYVEKLTHIRSVEDLHHLAINLPEMIDAIRWVSSEAFRNKVEMDSASSTLAELTKVIDSKNDEIDNLELALASERKNKYAMEERLDYFLDSVKLFNGIDLDPYRIFSTDKHDYSKILYFKEVSRVQYTDTFIHYLKEILKVVYKMPIRLCVIEPHFATGKVEQYNIPCHYELTENDVISGDVLMLGYQDKLMEDIMRNTAKIPILIVLDRAGYSSPHIRSTARNVEYFYLASDPRDIKETVPLTRVISYSEDTLYVPHIEGFESMDDIDRMSKYSGTSIMKAVVNLIEKG